MAKNTIKPKEEIGKGKNTAFCDSIKEEITKSKVVCCRLTSSEYELFVNSRGKNKTDSNYLREIIEKATS